jgi:octaprenyl-diphosphate synthase
MLGDYLISHAYHLCSSMGNEAVSRTIADTTNTVCEGELLQLANRFNWSLDEQSYFEIIRRKTASLCGVCCRLAADLGDRDTLVAGALYEYGEKVGIAFQIVDDLLDLVGVEKTVGKTLGRDMDKGKLTLPLIRHLSSTDAASRDAVLRILGKGRDGDAGLLNRDELDQIRQLVTDSGAVEYATDWARRMVGQAKAALEALPQSPPRQVLSSMADLVLTRRF